VHCPELEPPRADQLLTPPHTCDVYPALVLVQTRPIQLDGLQVMMTRESSKENPQVCHVMEGVHNSTHVVYCLANVGVLRTLRQGMRQLCGAPCIHVQQ
jgi:hypothetical protein